MRLRRSLAVVAALALTALAACTNHDTDTGTAVATPVATPASTPPPTSAPPTTAPPTTAPVTPSPTPGTPPAFAAYVALGDSYTAAPLVPQTDLGTGCYRSSGNYPSVLAASLGLSSTDVSCSAATTLSMIGVQQAGGHEEAPQFDAVNALGDAEALVTVGIGANDFDLFSTLVTTCTGLAASDPDGHPCQDQMHQAKVAAAAKHGKEAAQDADLLRSKIRKIQGRVTAVVAGIRDRAPQSRVVLVGYPQAVPATGTCAALPLARGDYAYVRSILTTLDGAMAAAARAGGATYVDVLKASSGHDICAGDDAWVNGSATDITRALAYHPFAAEQQAVAGLIEQKLGLG